MRRRDVKVKSFPRAAGAAMTDALIDSRPCRGKLRSFW